MPEISLSAETVFHLGIFPVTNSVILSVVTALLFIVFAFVLHQRLALVPGKFQNFAEIITENILHLMESVLGRRDLAIRYFPLIATIFLFVWVSNWLGLLPGVGSILVAGGHGEEIVHFPLFRAPAADLNFTIVLAMIAVFAVNALGIIAVGFKRYSKRFFHPKNPILSFAGFLELVSEFVKIISFSFRLFGNVFAGEVLLTIIGFLVPLFLPLPFLFLELFVGFIQAFIFAMLTLVFVAMAVSEETAH